jgi:hypothetical protein
MNEFKEPNWTTDTAAVVEEGRRAVAAFSTDCPLEVCSSFAFSVDYCFGSVTICFDTLENNLAKAKRHEDQTLESLDAIFLSENGWENAPYYLQRQRICTFNPHTANFRYPTFAKLHFPEWEGYFLHDQRPEHPDPLGRVIVLFYRAIRELVSTGTFDRLAMSSPFRVGVEFPEDFGLVVLRVLNWPNR